MVEFVLLWGKICYKRKKGYRRAERRIYRHGVRRRTRDTQLDSPQVGHRAHRRVGFGAAGRHD